MEYKITQKIISAFDVITSFYMYIIFQLHKSIHLICFRQFVKFDVNVIDHNLCDIH